LQEKSQRQQRQPRQPDQAFSASSSQSSPQAALLRVLKIVPSGFTQTRNGPAGDLLLGILTSRKRFCGLAARTQRPPRRLLQRVLRPFASGHIQSLEQARALGDALIVGLTETPVSAN